MPELLLLLVSVVLSGFGYLLLREVRRLGDAVLELLKELRRHHGVLETRPDARRYTPTTRPDAASDAPVQSVAPAREASVPQLAPQAIAPGLKRPPRPNGGFGTKVRDGDTG